GQQLVDGDLLAVGWIQRQVLGDFIGHGQLAALLKQEDGRGGELLGDRGDLEDQVGLHRYAELQIGQTVRLAEQDLTVLRDQDRGARLARWKGPGENLIRITGQLGVRDRPGCRGPKGGYEEK